MAVEEVEEVEEVGLYRPFSFAPSLTDIEAGRRSPESVELSDPETEDYYASSEGSNVHANLSSISSFANSTFRNDSATQWPFHRDATPAQPPKPASLHPAFRANPFSFSYEAESLEPRSIARQSLSTSKSVPQLRSPFDFSSRSNEQPTPVSPRHVERRPQLKKKLSNIFRFGSDNGSNFEPSNIEEGPASTEHSTKSKLDRIRESFTSLDIAGRLLRSLAGTKRPRQNNTAINNTNTEWTISPPKARRTGVNCRTPLPPSRIREATALLHETVSQTYESQPPRQRRVYREVTIAPHRQRRHFASASSARTTTQHSHRENGRPAPQQNVEALETLEGRPSGPTSPVPAELEAKVAQRTPGSPFNREEVADLRTCIRHAETNGMREDEPAL